MQLLMHVAILISALYCTSNASCALSKLISCVALLRLAATTLRFAVASSNNHQLTLNAGFGASLENKLFTL